MAEPKMLPEQELPEFRELAPVASIGSAKMPERLE